MRGADAVPFPAVCMFMEESSLGRQHWQQNLAPLLQCLVTTLRWVLQSQPTPGGTWGYLVIKVRGKFQRWGEGSVLARTGGTLAVMSRRDGAHSTALNGVTAFCEVGDTVSHPRSPHLSSSSSRPASSSSRHCQRTWPPWCGA